MNCGSSFPINGKGCVTAKVIDVFNRTYIFLFLIEPDVSEYVAKL